MPIAQKWQNNQHFRKRFELRVHLQIDKLTSFTINDVSNSNKKPVNVSNLMETVFVLVVKEFHPLPAERFSADRPYGYIGMNYYYKHILLISELSKAFFNKR